MTDFVPTKRTQVKRLAKRGMYDRKTVYQILDEGFICHVGFVSERHPVVIPTGYGRSGDRLYIHGSAASRMLRGAATGIEICITVTLLDGLVLSRSGFHSSMNYRSVVVFGKATMLQDPGEKAEALRTFSEHVMPGRWADIRPPSPQELSGTIVLAVPLQEVSAKVRTGPPLDDQEDYALPVWAGVLPLKVLVGEPIADPRMNPSLALALPDYVRAYRKGSNGRG